MEKQTSIQKGLLTVALGTTLILSIPLIAIQFTTEVDWSIGDFIVMGALLFGIGASYVVATRYIQNLVNRIAIAVALGSTLLLVWANLAVGLIGGGAHAGNLMYMGVIAVGVLGTIIFRFSTTGMERTMYAMAISLVLVAVIALLTGMQNYPGSSVMEIIAVNGFFALLFAFAGSLFRYVAHQQSQEKAEG